MQKRDRSTQSAGFGKRGSVSLNTPPPTPKSEPSGSNFNVPKWAMGGVAGVVLLAMIIGTGGMGGGGLLGGLLGGFLANKLMNSAKPSTPTATASSTPSAPRADSVARGGFGASGGASSSHGG